MDNTIIRGGILFSLLICGAETTPSRRCSNCTHWHRSSLFVGLDEGNGPRGARGANSLGRLTQGAATFEARVLTSSLDSQRSMTRTALLFDGQHGSYEMDDPAGHYAPSSPLSVRNGLEVSARTAGSTSARSITSLRPWT